MDPRVAPYLPLILGPWLWIAAWIVGSIVWRKSQGLPILTPRPADAVFFQGMCSGASQKNLFTRVFHANNALQVAVTPDLLVIRPFCPFNLMFIPELGDLEHYAPRATARAEIGGAYFFRTWLTVEFDAGDGQRRVVRLALKDPQAFLAALSGGRSPAAG